MLDRSEFYTSEAPRSFGISAHRQTTAIEKAKKQLGTSAIEISFDYHSGCIPLSARLTSLMCR